MPNETSASILYGEIFARMGVMDTPAGTNSFELLLARGSKVRIDYDPEDELIWMTTAYAALPEEGLEQLLPRLLRLNHACTLPGAVYGLDAGLTAVLVQSRLEGDAPSLADFDAVLQRHLESVDATEREFDSLGTDPSPQPSSDAEALPGEGAIRV
jgi:hypothetical protein